MNQTSDAVATHFGARSILVEKLHCQFEFTATRQQQQSVGADPSFAIAPLLGNTRPINFLERNFGCKFKLRGFKNQKVVSETVMLGYNYLHDD